MIGRARDERGVALIIAILGMVVMGGMVTAAFTTTWMEFRLADNTRRAAQAIGAAEFGLAQTINNWEVGVWNNMGVLDSIAVSDTSSYGHGRYRGYVIRMTQDLFLVDITGSVRGGLSQQRVGEYVRLNAIQVDIQASLTVKGPTRIGGNATVIGDDVGPPGWGSCTPLDGSTNLSGVRVADRSDLTLQGSCSDESCLSGTPTITEDPGVDDSTFDDFGGMTWDELVQFATVLPTGLLGDIGPVFDPPGVCKTSVSTNWGDPLNPASACGQYFPLLYVPGNLKLSKGAGQGMLLVEGNLQVSGKYNHYGVVIVRGELSSTGQGQYHGAVLAANVNLEDSKLLGNAMAQYSSCATARALKSAAPASRLSSRGWVYR